MAVNSFIAEQRPASKACLDPGYRDTLSRSTHLSAPRAIPPVLDGEKLHLTMLKWPEESVKHPFRILSLRQGQDVPIGRSSSNNAKDLHASFSNAYFDCKVMSRFHGTFSAPEGLPGPVFITDTSKYGIFVNDERIPSKVAWRLTSGDKIKLGDDVGSDEHHPVYLGIVFNEHNQRRNYDYACGAAVFQPSATSPIYTPSSPSYSPAPVNYQVPDLDTASESPLSQSSHASVDSNLSGGYNHVVKNHVGEDQDDVAGDDNDDEFGSSDKDDHDLLELVADELANTSTCAGVVVRPTTADRSVMNDAPSVCSVANEDTEVLDLHSTLACSAVDCKVDDLLNSATIMAEAVAETFVDDEPLSNVVSPADDASHNFLTTRGMLYEDFASLMRKVPIQTPDEQAEHLVESPQAKQDSAPVGAIHVQEVSEPKTSATSNGRMSIDKLINIEDSSVSALESKKRKAEALDEVAVVGDRESKGGVSAPDVTQPSPSRVTDELIEADHAALRPKRSRHVAYDDTNGATSPVAGTKSTGQIASLSRRAVARRRAREQRMAASLARHRRQSRGLAAYLKAAVTVGTYATIGSIATIAFLASPLAERLAGF